MKDITIKNLQTLAKALSTLCLVAACQPTETVTQLLIDQNPQPDTAPIVITEESAKQLIDNDPWEYFTDFGSPYYCLHSPIEPETTEPVWANPTTVWQRLRLGFQMDWQIEQPRLDSEFNWYQRNPAYMARVSERSKRYIHYVTEKLEARGLPLELALLPIVESAYDPFAYSHGRASGMWQFIPSTGRMYKLNQDWWYDGRRDIVASTDAAIDYLETLANYYDGDWLLALAAYNSGQGNVNKAIRKNKKRGKDTDFWSLDLPKETRAYVPKLLALAKLVAYPRRFNIQLHTVPNTAYFAEVDTHSQIDLAQAATMAGISIDELYRLNPGFNRWATSPKGPHRLLVPVENEELFTRELAQLPPSQRMHWQRYTVKTGDSLLLLAKRFNTGADTIKQINNISGNMIRAGQALMIPMASENGQHYSLSADQRLQSIHKSRTGGSNSQQSFHQVKDGESLWTISRKYNVTVSKLAHWNGIAPKDTLQPGQKLSVWTKEPKTSFPGQRKSVTKKIGYYVRTGDSLARIGDKFNVSIDDIVKWNRVNTAKYLQPGQKLTLYIDIMNAVN
ncbi:MAG: LysM peptidoglycan-binding domain-containing protein [Oceanicoccus sp.]